ncbi:hypothetical protein CDL15_Pgr002585 [Punica granatum]|uniref:Uncharacterized protein n=1 Tax=Punica granatum TaxID=22663 RepID=A0A218WXX5_PUNGR|nr:hypothetical protein CDL15_Pgr002585 [Punica granatum]
MRGGDGVLCSGITVLGLGNCHQGREAGGSIGLLRAAEAGEGGGGSAQCGVTGGASEGILRGAMPEVCLQILPEVTFSLLA